MSSHRRLHSLARGLHIPKNHTHSLDYTPEVKLAKYPTHRLLWVLFVPFIRVRLFWCCRKLYVCTSYVCIRLSAQCTLLLQCMLPVQCISTTNVSAGVTQKGGKTNTGALFLFSFSFLPPPSSCGACLNFYREKGPGVPFPSSTVLKSNLGTYILQVLLSFQLVSLFTRKMCKLFTPRRFELLRLLFAAAIIGTYICIIQVVSWFRGYFTTRPPAGRPALVPHRKGRPPSKGT